jgi:hypothetical protein
MSIYPEVLRSLTIPTSILPQSRLKEDRTSGGSNLPRPRTPFGIIDQYTSADKPVATP